MTNKYFEFNENMTSYIAADGSKIVVRDRIAVDDGNNPAITSCLKNLEKQGRCVEVEQTQAESVQATFALGDPMHRLREQVRQEERAKLMAELGNNGIATSANVNLPHAGVSNGIETPETQAEATKTLAALAGGKK